MKVLLTTLTFVAVLAFGFYLYENLDTITKLAECYQEANAIYHDKYLVSRRTYLEDDEICERNRLRLETAQACQEEIPPQYHTRDTLDAKTIHQLAQIFSRENKDLPGVIADHNQNCPDHSIEIDQ